MEGNTFRGLFLDLCGSSQVVCIEWHDGQLSTGRIVKVGADYLIMEVFGLSEGEGGVISMPAFPIGAVRCVNLRPIFADTDGPGAEAEAEGAEVA